MSPSSRRSSAPTALQPDGSIDLSPTDVDAMAGVIAGLAAAPSVPTTIAARPETIDALLGSPEPGLAELVDALRTAVAGRTVLDQTVRGGQPGLPGAGGPVR